MPVASAVEGVSTLAASEGLVVDEVVDWERIERSPEFRELVQRRRRFLIPASAFFFSFFIAYLLLVTFATGFVGAQIVPGLPVGWLLAVCQVLMTWGLTRLYLRRADGEFEPLERRAAARAAQAAGGNGSVHHSRHGIGGQR